MMDVTNRPLAANGLRSYRYYNGAYGWVMIGAKDADDALNQAERSIDSQAYLVNLEVWNGSEYVEALPTHKPLQEEG